MKSPKRHKPFPPARMDSIQAGLVHHRAGRLRQASACYATALAANPHNADALNLSGVIARQQGDSKRSERLISQAIVIDPAAATYHHQLARTLEQQHRTSEAIEHYRLAIALNPSDVDSHRLLARLFLTVDQTGLAMSLFESLLVLDPQAQDAYYSLGALHKSMGNYATAIDYYRRATILFPDSADGQFNLATTLYEAGHFAECIPLFQQILRANPEDQEAVIFLGQAFHELTDYAAARACYVAALRLNPESCSSLMNLGALYMDTGDLRNAELLFRRTLELDPTFLDAHANLGTLHSKQGMIPEAIQSLKNVLTADPRRLPALCSLGCILFNLGDEQAAEACYRMALEVKPGSPIALFNLSSSLLTDGRFAEGWEAYEMRWQVRQFASEREILAAPRWTGEDLNGQRIYVHSEQGFGDTLHFARYALLLVQRGAEVILSVQPPLMQLLYHLHPRVRVVPKGDATSVPLDFYCPLLSLPRVFQTDLSNLPAHVPYLRPHSEDLPYWSSRIASPHLRVGIVWSGNPLHTRDRIRSIPADVFRTILEIPDITFYSLQKGSAAVQLSLQGVVDLDAELNDFSQTAAAIVHLDLVISVDTAVAHLAGALGKPVWILLSLASDWRWLKERSDSPWYPTARLFRQSVLGKWEDVMSDVCRELEELVASRSTWSSSHSHPGFHAYGHSDTLSPGLGETT